jgi:hypothetical protein
MDISVFDVIGDFAIALAGAAVAVVGAWLANSYRRRMRFELAEARRTAYSNLWELTGLAAPTRLDTAGLDGALTKAERQSLYQDLTDWYYKDGGGMLLEDVTKNVYLTAKHNLVCATDKFKPNSAWVALNQDLSVDQEVARGVLSIRQLSLLRTQLKADLAIFGQSYTKELARHEREFLIECEVKLNREPWSRVEREDRKEEVVRKAEPGQPLGIPLVSSTDEEQSRDDPLAALWRLVETWRGR